MQASFCKKSKKENTLQNQLKGFIIPTRNKKNHIENNKFLNLEPSHIGIQLVRFDENNKRTSSSQLIVVPHLCRRMNHHHQPLLWISSVFPPSSTTSPHALF